MNSFIVRSAFGLVAAVALVAVPAEAKAQYGRPGVGISVATPNIGINLGYIQAPVYRPAPVFVPAYPSYPGYVGYGPRPFAAPVVPHWTPYRGWHTHSAYGPQGPYSNHNHSHGRQY